MTIFTNLPVLLAAVFAAAPVLCAETIADLKAREAKVLALVTKVKDSIVAITSEDPGKPGSGSGVIVQKDGLILTAAHVTAATGENLIITFPDGKRVKGKALGANRVTDAGLAKITDEGEWPAVEIGSSDKMLLGDSCVAMANPGGLSIERRHPVRYGRIWKRDLDGAIFSSCALIGGDSGGPLFDLEGRVIGINSSIHGDPDSMNRHVAVDTLREDWDRMMKEKAWGRQGFTAGAGRPRFGAVFDPDSQEGVKVIEDVNAESPAGKAGLKNGDVLVKFDGVEVATFHHLKRLIGKKEAGDKVKLGLRRGAETVECELELGKPASPATQERNAKEENPEEKNEKDKGPPEPKIPDESGPQSFFGAELEDTGGKGARVVSVKEGSPAAKAGLVAGDIILHLNDKDVDGPTPAAEVIRPLKPGDKLSVKAKRGETDHTGETTIEERKL